MRVAVARAVNNGWHGEAGSGGDGGGGEGGGDEGGGAVEARVEVRVALVS